MDKQKNLTENFSNDMRKDSAIKDRVSLISAHMYKQFLDHQSAMANTKEMFYALLKESDNVVNYLKNSFSSRSISAEHINSEIDFEKTTCLINILWHSITFKMRENFKPQALQRQADAPLFSGRIIAFNGNFKNTKLTDDDYPDILEHEIASLYIPADKTKNYIIKIKHVGDKEFPINSIDAPREFLLKVTEIICGGGIYHEQFSDKD